MTVPATPSTSALIWATRGRSWGFRFLLDGGKRDPLFIYERAFADVEDEPACCCTVDGLTAIRFPDPHARRDSAGRVIPHEFVLPEHAAGFASVQDGQAVVWPLVSATYDHVWDNATPPSGSDIQRLLG